MEKFKALFTQKVRRRIYAIAVVVGGVLVTHGLLSVEDMTAALQVIGLSIGVIGVPAMAMKNTPNTDE